MSNVGPIGSRPVGGTDSTAAAAAAAPSEPALQPIALTNPKLSGDATLRAIAEGTATLERGARGPAVQTVQQALIDVGIDVRGGADGIFGTGTVNAIAAFQRRSGLEASGKLDQATLAALDRALPAGGTGGGAAALASAALKGDATLEAVAAGTATLERGARGTAVKKVQQALIDAGIQVRGGADGSFGSGTAAAVSAFQSQKGLPATGKLDQATIRALDQALAAGGTGGTGATPAANARFASDPTLQKVLNGQAQITSGAHGPHVQIVQQALLDIGYNMPVYGADGGFGGEAATAVKRFQRDMGLPQTGRVDKATLQALGRVAPPPGKTLERNPEYDKLFEDGRLDMTIALGYDEGGSHDTNTFKVQSGLRDQGFTKINPATMSAADRARLGVGADRYEPGAIYYTKKITDPSTQKPVDIVVKLITPDSAATPEAVRDMFKRSLERDEVVSYNGHARYGTGPDFDPIESGAGNFVIDRDGGPTGHPHAPLTDALAGKPESMLKDLKPYPGKYQLLYFNACTTDNYMENLRDPAKMLGRNPQNTDIIGTTMPSYIATGADNLLGFVSMLSGRGSINSFVGDVGKRESDLTQRFIDQGVETEKNDKDVKRAGGLLFESGFADNSSNRIK